MQRHGFQDLQVTLCIDVSSDQSIFECGAENPEDQMIVLHLEIFDGLDSIARWKA